MKTLNFLVERQGFGVAHFAIETGIIVERDGFVFADLVPALTALP